MSFFKSKATPPVRGKGGSPYLNGREEWLERYGSYISRAASTLRRCRALSAGKVVGAQLPSIQKEQ